MSFSFRSRPTMGRPSVKELRADVKELVETVLPCFQNRPSLYNDISKEVQRMKDEIKAIVLGATAAAEDDTDFTVHFLPPNSAFPNSLAELKKDRMVLGQLWEIPQRKQVRSILSTIRDQIHADLETNDAIQKQKADERRKQLSEDRALLTFVLDTIKDRPHIHRKIMEAMEGDYHVPEEEEIMSSSLHLLPQQQQQQRRKQFDSRNFSNVSIGSESTHAMSVVDDDEDDNDHTTTVQVYISSTTTAADRWEDVSRVDELIDIVPETSLTLYDLLCTFKKAYRDEAKELQRAESNKEQQTVVVNCTPKTMTGTVDFGVVDDSEEEPYESPPRDTIIRLSDISI